MKIRPEIVTSIASVVCALSGITICAELYANHQDDNKRSEISSLMMSSQIPKVATEYLKRLQPEHPQTGVMHVDSILPTTKGTACKTPAPCLGETNPPHSDPHSEECRVTAPCITSNNGPVTPK